MQLISLHFGLFFLTTLLSYYFIPLAFRWVVLLVGSVVFYFLSATPCTALYLVFSIISVYLAARYIAGGSTKHRKAVYRLTVGGNLALLALLKYANGFFSIASPLFHIVGSDSFSFSLDWIAPLGISYYTLQLIGYLTDVYWDITPAQKNPAKIVLFASYFPSIGSGPILRYQQMESALFSGHKASYQNLTFGLQRILWGAFKKMVIADRLATVSSAVFVDYSTTGGFWIWIGLFAAVIQVYADFSGNMDFVLGVSECFGIRLPENFRQPFFSRTIQEVFQRWHITLGTWLKDYIMYPVLRSRLFARFGKFLKKTHFGKAAVKTILPICAMLVLWLANGVWHGAYAKYLVTGLWYWFAVTAGQLLEPAGKRLVRLLKINTRCFSWRLFQRVRTFLVFSVGVLFFSSSDVMTALRLGKQALLAHNIHEIFSFSTLINHQVFALFGGVEELILMSLSLLILFMVEVFQSRGKDIRASLANQNLFFRWMCFYALIYITLFWGVLRQNVQLDFIYFQF